MDDGALAAFFKRGREDPVFMVDALLPKKTRQVIDGEEKVHHGQQRWLREAFAPINVLVPGNRFGKSTVVEDRHFWFAMTKFVPGRRFDPREWKRMKYETISLAYSSEQANIVFNGLRHQLSHPVVAPFVKSIRESPYPRITLFNGSVIHVRSAHDNGKYVDGFEYRYISLDEAGYIDNLKSLVNGVLLMRLAGGGILDLLGTPKGVSSQGLYWYANRALNGTKRYFGLRGSIYDNPFLPAADVKMRDELLMSSDPRMRAQVIEGEFVDYDGLAFTTDQRENLFRAGMPAHVDYIEGHKYVQAWDLGRRTDASVCLTLDVTREPWLVVDYVRLWKVPWEEIYRQIEGKAKEYHVTDPRIDATGPQGDVVEEELWNRGVFVDAFRTSNQAMKLDLINTLQVVLDHGREQVGWTTFVDEAGVVHKVPIMDEPQPDADTWGLVRCPPITQIVDEMGVYRHDDKKLTQDTVMALALVCEKAWSERDIAEPLIGGLY